MPTQSISTTYNDEEFGLIISYWVTRAVKDELLAQQSHMEPINNILTRQETAKLLNISLPTLHEYTTKLGLIKAYRLGTKVRYKRQEVENALVQINTGRTSNGK